MNKKLLVGSLLLVAACAARDHQPRTVELVFDSGPFKLVGDLRFPEESGPYPVVVFVHGDGSNSRTGGVTYPPIMERMARAGYATFAWDKPGTGESTGRIDRSRLLEQRSQIVLDAIALLKQRPEIDPESIGLWGISQAGYVMPKVLELTDDVAFMIAVSCPGTAGVDQGIYLLAKQMVCAGYPEQDFENVQSQIRAFTIALTYEEYARHKEPLAANPFFQSLERFGQRIEVGPKEDWHADDREGDYYWNPMGVIERTTIPVLAFFGGKDTQVDPLQGVEAYSAALQRAGNPKSRVELIPDSDHNIILSESGCIEERDRRPRRGWTNYAPEYLDVVEEWLRELRQDSPEQDAADLEARIRRVENGLILMREDRSIAWGESGTIAERMAHYNVPGIGIAVIDDFEIAWAKGYGVLESGRDDPVTAQTLFHAGSISKSLAATGAMALVERGQLELDQDVNERLRSWHIPEDDYTAGEKVTLRRLLSHSAGLTDGWSDSGIECCYSVAGAAPTVTIQQMLEAHPATELELPTRVTTSPGQQYRYSNLGYGILELLLVDITGQAFPVIMRELVLEPIAMTSSSFEQPLPETLRSRAASEHYEGGEPFEGTRHHFPVRAAGGLWTTPSDLARFAIEIMRAYSGTSNRILSQEAVVEMLTPQIAVHDNPVIAARGLAFGLRGAGESLEVLHTGATWGSTSVLWAVPATGQGVVVMTNGGGDGLIRFEILLSVASEYDWPQ